MDCGPECATQQKPPAGFPASGLALCRTGSLERAGGYARFVPIIRLVRACGSTRHGTKRFDCHIGAAIPGGLLAGFCPRSANIAKLYRASQIRFRRELQLATGQTRQRLRCVLHSDGGADDNNRNL